MIAASYQTPDYMFFVLNVVIVCGYITTALVLMFSRKMLPLLRVILGRNTRIAGAAFFLIASITRAELAWKVVVQEPYLNLTNPDSAPTHVNFLHLIQALLLWTFIILAARDMTKVLEDGNGRSNLNK